MIKRNQSRSDAEEASGLPAQWWVPSQHTSKASTEKGQHLRRDKHTEKNPIEQALLTVLEHLILQEQATGHLFEEFCPFNDETRTIGDVIGDLQGLH